MLKRCINHGFYDLIQISIFRNRLQQLPKLLLDATTGGSLMSKSVEDIIVIIKKMALNDHQGQYNRNPSQRKIRIIGLNTNNEIISHNKLLTHICGWAY